MRNFQQIKDELFSPRVKIEYLITFFRQLAALINAGMPLYQAMNIVKQQTRNKAFKGVLEDFLKGLQEGKTLAENMSSYPRIFSQFMISTISVGEAKGSLNESLQRIEVHLVKTRDVRNRIVAALTYPLLLVAAGIAVLLIMIIMVLPKFVEIFEETNIDLPKPTRVIVMINSFLMQNYLWLLLLLLLFGLSLMIFRKTTKGRKILDTMILHLPISGRILQSAYAARFGRTFGTLYSSGIPILEALELTAGVFNNIIWKSEINSLIYYIKNGESLTSAITKARNFPVIMKQMLSVGEESSSIDQLALEAARFYEEETEYILQKQLSLLEPIALMIIATTVAFLAAAVLLPLFRMASGIRAV